MEIMAPKEYIQVGYTALRHPGTGEFMPAVPLFIQADDDAKDAEQRVIDDIGGLLARRMKAYKEGCREAGVTV